MRDGSTIKSQVAALLRKNWWLTKRTKIMSLLCYVLLPMVVIAFSVGVSIIITPASPPKDLYYSAAPILGYYPTQYCLKNNPDSICFIGISPNISVSSLASESLQEQIFDQFFDLLVSAYPKNSFQRFDSPLDMELAFNSSNGRMVSGVVFDSSSYPSHLSYDIRLDSYYLPTPPLPEKASGLLPSINELTEGAKAFATSGFVDLQTKIDSTIGNWIARFGNMSSSHQNSFWSNSNKRIEQNVEAETKELSILSSSSEWPEFSMAPPIPIILNFCYLGLGFFGPIYCCLVDMVEDRVSKLKDYLKIMGLKEASFWIAHFISALLSQIPALIALIASTIAIGFWGPNPGYGMLFIILHCLACISFVMCLAAVAPSTKVATSIIALFFVLPFVVVFFINIPIPAKVALALLAPINFQFTLVELWKRRVIHAISPLRSTPASLLSLGEYPMTAAILMYLVDIILYSVLAWYFSQVLGGSEDFGGTPKPWYFLFQKSYWFPKRMNEADGSDSEEQRLLNLQDDLSYGMEQQVKDPQYFEPNHGDQDTLRVRLRALRKVYPKAETAAVIGTDLDIHQGIFVLLGENGSGKSTTINMLTGLLPLTSGEAIIDGYDLQTNLDQVRQSISICPQHDLLSEKLTGSEHLKLFAILKGCDPSDLDARISKTLNDVGLDGKGDDLVKSYSGGMKRSLSLGISLVADSRIVFIDEASSGMDMEKRRSLWAMLNEKKKQGTTIVLTTHYMEEAENLGDRIGIMHQGSLIREGSLEFLKRELGYQIHASNPISDDVAEVSYGSDDLKTEHVPLTQRDSLPERLAELESKYRNVSVTTPNLEDVFIEISQSFALKGAEDVKPTQPFNRSNFPPARFKQQVTSLTKKLIRAESRSIGSILLFILLPVLVTLFGLSMTRVSTNAIRTLPSLRQDGNSNPVAIELSQSLPLILPYTTYNNQTLQFLNPWKRSTLQFEYLKDSSQFGAYLWGNSSAVLAHEGGFQTGWKWNGKDRFDYQVAFNRTDIYSLPRLVNFINNAIIPVYLDDSAFKISRDPTNLFVKVKSVPFISKRSSNEASLLEVFSIAIGSVESQFGFQLVLSLTILVGVLGRAIVKDKERQIIPQLQRVGLSPFGYWIEQGIIAFVKLSMSALMAIAVVACFNIQFLRGITFLFFIFSCFLLVISMIPLLFLIVKLFNRADQAQKFLPVILILLFYIPSMISAFLISFSSMSKNQALQSLSNYVALLSPLSIFPTILTTLSYTWIRSLAPLSGAVAFKAIYLYWIAMIVHIIIYVLVLILLERNGSKISTEAVSKSKSQRQQSLLPDPAAEESTLDQLPNTFGLPLTAEQNESQVELDANAIESSSILVEGLWKQYQGAEKRAVMGLWLNIPRGTCFGLLGPNGAGKSTSISMLIGDLSPSGGSYSLDGVKAIGEDKTELFKKVRLACCLQTDSLFDEMTVKEHVDLYLQIRNQITSSSLLDSISMDIIVRFKLLPHINKLAKQLSGGNKRKLCTALATLTFNNIVVLDEPSTGCDPHMRRTLWEVIKSEQASKGILLTTHSMDEADAVCNQIGIMVNGQLLSLGTPHSLKSACGGYELRLTVGDPDFDLVAFEESHIKSAFPGAQLIESNTTHDGSIDLKYDVGAIRSISSAFATLKEWSEKTNILDYALSQTTLATAYQRVVRQQTE